MDSTQTQFENNPLFLDASLAGQDFPAPALYVVGLPIGNLADITLRALWTLKLSDAIAAEDTRESKKILQNFNIETRLFAVHQHNEQEGAQRIIEFLKQGMRVSLVTDAGTPAISDPGSKVVDHVRTAGFRVIPIPGPSAVVTALSAAGMAPEGFVFYGFLPDGSKERLQILKNLCEAGKTFVLYEAPHRMNKLSGELESTVPEGRKIVVARELTKKFEEFLQFGKASELAGWYQAHKPLGEFVVIVDAEDKKTGSELDAQTRSWLKALTGRIPTKELSELASSATGLPKKALYQEILLLQKETVSEL